jgi:FAD:protein FMN transferase
LRIKFITILTFCLFSVFINAQQKYIFNQPKMGSPFIITVFARDTEGLQAVVDKAYIRVDELNKVFSDYDSTSEISKLARTYRVGEWYPVSNDLYYMLKISLDAARASSGAFDVTVGNVVKLWRKAKKSKTIPSSSERKSALSKTGWQHILIDEKTHKIGFNTEGVLLDFGGIVKGFAAELAVEILTLNKFPMCLVDAGGDLAVGNKPQNTVEVRNPDKVGKGPHSESWQIGISIPQSETELMPQMLSLHNQAVATSGDMYNNVSFEGKRYSHIVNPRTGMGLTHQRNVTVIAPVGHQADWLATACSVLPIKKAMKLMKKYPNAELLILEMRKGKIKSWQTSGFAKYFSLN